MTKPTVTKPGAPRSHPPQHCIDESRIDAVLRSSEDSAERRHAKDCPRCHALLDSYFEFMMEPASRDAAFQADADLAGARERLQRFARERLPLTEPTLSATDTPRRATVSASSARSAPEGFFDRFLSLFRSPVRLAALAACAVLVFAILRVGGPDDGVRGPDDRDPHETRLEVRPARLVQAGVEFAWTPWEGATGYDLILIDRQLQVVRRIDTGGETKYILSGADRAAAGHADYWQVSARGASGSLMTSRLEELP